MSENSGKEQQDVSQPLVKSDIAEESKKVEAEFRDDTAHVAKTRTITTTIRDTWWRFLFLATCCGILVASYFCYDNPAPVEKKLKQVFI